MGEEEGERQRLKKIAAAAYDYDMDPRWADYWSNILIPPHMAARSDVVDHFKRKFYQRYIVRFSITSVVRVSLSPVLEFNLLGRLSFVDPSVVANLVLCVICYLVPFVSEMDLSVEKLGF